MILPLNRCCAVFLVSIILAGCQSLPLLQKSSSTETESFARGLDQYSATGDLQALKRLPQDYPDGAWAPRAELVVKLAEQQEKCVADNAQNTDVKAGGQKQQTLVKDKELTRCQDDMAALRQNNQDLEETIARLKKLLIEMESRSN
jgi:hypothetical protein